MCSTEDEPTLISNAVAGDSAALELLLFRRRKRLLAYVQAHFPAELVGFIEPQDVLQDTWLKAIRAISDFHPDGPDPVYRWVVTIARNVILDQIRHARTAKRKSTRVPLERTDENASIIRLLEEMAVYHRTPSKSAASHELIAALDSAIERLPSDQARALRLRHLEGLEIREIAHRMRRTVGSVSMLCNRALKSLRWEMRSVSLYM